MGFSMKLIRRWRYARARRRLERHLATADMATRSGQVQAERLRDAMIAAARREGLR